METKTEGGFDELALSKEVLAAVRAVGYERPSPIQQQIIPYMLSGNDVLGQAQTGTGKTGAFALPILSNLDLNEKSPQVLVLIPTRELAIQVAEAFQSYATGLKQFYVQPIYGGQDYSVQLRSLKRGVHVVVGTPGRVLDHIKRGTLKLDRLTTLVLDEADEMLRMGFIDDVQWVMDRLPKKRQIALFSATMPPAIRRIADRYLVEPKVVQVKSKTTTADTVRQRYWIVRKIHKLDALTRMLDAETFDAALVFVRTKSATLELAEKLKARGFAAEALNGDIAQAQREKTVRVLKKGGLDIIVATDVAARGLDVERISHVINYDIPFDPESYVHRIGRTGRAGRKGDAILFVSPREQRMLRTIERSTRNKIEPMEVPTREDVAKKRRAEFKKRLHDTIRENDLGTYATFVEEFVHENEISFERVAAALAKLSEGDRPLDAKETLDIKPEKEKETRKRYDSKPGRSKRKPFKSRRTKDSDNPKKKTFKPKSKPKSKLSGPKTKSKDTKAKSKDKGKRHQKRA